MKDIVILITKNGELYKDINVDEYEGAIIECLKMRNAVSFVNEPEAIDWSGDVERPRDDRILKVDEISMNLINANAKYVQIFVDDETGEIAARLKEEPEIVFVVSFLEE